MHIRRWLAALLTVFGLMILSLSWQGQRTAFAQTTPVRIMPLGDSITQADSQRDSYRRALWQLLQAGAYNVDFVGSLTEHFGGPPPNADFDQNHEGHWGWRTDQILNSLPNWAAVHQPDVVLVHLGSNDLFQGQSVASTITELGQIIDVLRAARPNVIVLLAQIIPNGSVSVVNLNNQIATLAGQKTTAQSPVIVVDQFTGFNVAADTYDSTHPNASGEQKMANRWYAALQSVLTPGGPTLTPTFTPTPTNTPQPGERAFYRAINLNGPALTIDGNAWEALTAPNYTTNGFASCNPWQSLVPSTDTNRTSMIRCHVQHWAHAFTMSGLTAGSYEVYVYTWLDWNNTANEPFSLSIEGQTAQTGILLNGAGQWLKLGPFVRSVNDGVLNVTTSGGLPNLSGIEVWRAGG